ncbi:MAG: cell wall hydrolase [Gudongella sp.]|nr:cell wall hydrolase [Gudongella sp.]
MYLKDHGPLLRSIIWMGILILVLLFWPTKVESPIIKEVLIKTHYVYVDKVTDLPEEVVLEESEPIIPPRYGFTDDDIYLMTVLLCGSGDTDGDGEYDVDFGNQDNHEQISLVLSVVMNRVMSSKFPNTVSEVIWAPNQFSPMPRWRGGLPKVKPESYAIVKAWCDAYDSNDLTVMSIPETHLYFTGNGTINKSRERW